MTSCAVINKGERRLEAAAWKLAVHQSAGNEHLNCAFSLPYFFLILSLIPLGGQGGGGGQGVSNQPCSA